MSEELTLKEFIIKMDENPGWEIWFNDSSHVMTLFINRPGNNGIYFSPNLLEAPGEDFRLFQLYLDRVREELKEHGQAVSEDDFEPGRRIRAIGPDGKTWCESTIEKEVRERMRPGDVLQRLYEKTETEWRTIS